MPDGDVKIRVRMRVDKFVQTFLHYTKDAADVRPTPDGGQTRMEFKLVVTEQWAVRPSNDGDWWELTTLQARNCRQLPVTRISKTLPERPAHGAGRIPRVLR